MNEQNPFQWFDEIQNDIRASAYWYVRVVLKDRVKKQEYRAKVIKSLKVRRYNNFLRNCCGNTRGFYELPKWRFER